MKTETRRHIQYTRILLSVAIGLLPVIIGSAIAASDALFWGPEGLPLPFVFVFMALFPPAYAFGMVSAIGLGLISSAYAAWVLLNRKSNYLFLFSPIINAGIMLMLMFAMKA